MVKVFVGQNKITLVNVKSGHLSQTLTVVVLNTTITASCVVNIMPGIVIISNLFEFFILIKSLQKFKKFYITILKNANYTIEIS